jgi:UDP-N-acetylglucosamine--dolichyl-phosphate N-acetylglucosaminephosphotransferase
MLLYAVTAGVITVMATPLVARYMKSHNICGNDVHKSLEVTIPEMGGISYIISLTIVFGLAFVLLHDIKILGVLMVMLITAAIGAYDDLKGLNQYKKVVLTAIGGIPLIFFVEDTTIDFIVATMDFSWVYYILVVLAVSACSNATNILAGFNGEEAGLGAIAAFSLGISCILLGRYIPQLFLFSLCFSLLGFLIYNKYPAYVFPGDVGTLPIGAIIAVAVIFGKIELLGFMALLPAITEFFLKFRIKFTGKEYGPTKVIHGYLHPPPYLSVANALTETFALTEKLLVFFLWTLGGICGIISVAMAFLMK